MGVDVSALIVYGFQIDGDEYGDYKNLCDEREEDLSDYFIFINDYALDYGGVFGISLQGTDTVCEVHEYSISKQTAEAMLKEWRNAFPQRANEQPKFLLVCQWW